VLYSTNDSLYAIDYKYKCLGKLRSPSEIAAESHFDNHTTRLNTCYPVPTLEIIVQGAMHRMRRILYD
jgi:hypothetical protein